MTGLSLKVHGLRDWFLTGELLKSDWLDLVSRFSDWWNDLMAASSCEGQEEKEAREGGGKKDTQRLHDIPSRVCPR